MNIFDLVVAIVGEDPVTLPKASGGTSDQVYTEVQHRVYSLNYRIKEYEQKIAEVHNRIPFVEGDREVEVLHRLLDGNSLRSIGKQMRLSSMTIFRVRKYILSQMMK